MRTRRLLPVLLVAPLLAACGGGGSSSSTTSALPLKATKLAAVKQTLQPVDLVLDSNDMGAGWIPVPAQTKAISLTEQMKGETATMKRIEKRAYRSGYKALFANENEAGVLISVSSYKSTSDVRALSDLGLKQVRSQGLTRLPNPAHPPGTGFTLWHTTVKTGGKKVATWAAIWAHGDMGLSVIVFGKGQSAATAVAYARKQDKKVADAVAAAA